MSILSNIELVYWNLPEDPPTVADTREQLTLFGFDQERADDISEATAFRRAAAELAGSDTLVRCWKRKKDKALTVQIDSESEDEEGFLRRERISVYALVRSDPAKEDLPLKPSHVRGKELSFADAFAVAQQQYTGADVSKVIQAILAKDGLGSYSPRKGGAVYFVPVRPETPDLLNRLEAFSRAVSVRFLRYQVPDLAAQREEIAAAVEASLAADLDAHAAAIEAYHAETRPGVLENRSESITHTQETIGKLANLLGEHVELLTVRIAALRTQLAAKIEIVEAAKAAAEAVAKQTRPSRRIVAAQVPSPVAPVQELLPLSP